MDSRTTREKLRVISRCERDGWVFASKKDGEGSSRTIRMSSFVANLEGKRRQVIERLLERTLSNYLDPIASDAGQD